MIKCEKCEKIFSSIFSLAAHLTHKNSTCKCSVKEYYDSYLRKQKEGICIYCSGETLFYGLGKGYKNDKCKHCRNKGIETQTKRKRTYNTKAEEKKIKDEYYLLSEICHLCNKRFKTRRGLAHHIARIHEDEINLQDYYDKYFKEENEGICPITGKETTLKNFVVGYHTYNGKGTCSADSQIKEQKKFGLIKKYGVTNPCYINSNKRTQKYKETINNRKQLNMVRHNFLILLRKISIIQNNKLQCQICGEMFLNYSSHARHIKKHRLPIRIYYDNYFKKNNEGVCLATGETTTFISLESGYRKYQKNCSNVPEVVKKIKKHLMERTRKNVLKKCYKYNVKIIDITELQNIHSLLQLRCLRCNKIYRNRFYNLQLGYGKCPGCFPKNTHTSINEKEIYDFLKNTLPKEIIIYKSYRGLIEDLELDIYIPSKNIAIEFNGLYWHSEKILSDPVHYHINKTNLCREHGIQLIHIFEDEWIEKKEILKKMLLHKIGESDKKTIHARQCVVKEIDANTKNIFLEMNHIQGKDYSKIKLGLFTRNDQLVAVMTFSGKNLSKGTINIKDTDWELSRFATDLNYKVIGAAGKLLKYFKCHFIWSSVFSYADLRYSTGGLYSKLGFKKVNQTLPNYWYVKGLKRIYRFNLRKKSDEPKDIPEWKLRIEQGFYRIWDCGNIKFELLSE